MAIRAGHKVTVADFDSIGVFALKTGTESVTSSTTLQNDDQLFLPVAANAKYALEGFIAYTADAAGDLKRDFTGPSGTTMSYANFGANAGGLTEYDVVMASLSDVTRVLGGNGATAMCFQPKGYVATGGSSGILQFRFAQNVSSGVATSVLVGSWIKLTRLV